MKNPRRIPAGIPQTGASRVDLEQVECEPLAKHVSAVARDAIAGRVDGDPPFTAEGEVDDDRATGTWLMEEIDRADHPAPAAG